MDGGKGQSASAVASDGRVVVYEPRRLVREGLASFLQHEHAVVDTCAAPAELDREIRRGAAAVVIGVDGADNALWSVLERCARKLQRMHAIAVVNECDAVTARHARKLGIRVVTCDDGLTGIVEALRATRWSTTATRSRVSSWHSPGAPSRLTTRELAVVRLISLGLTAHQIAGELGITAKTVENHKQRIYRKLDVQSQSQAVGVALRRGLLQPVRPFDLPLETG